MALVSGEVDQFGHVRLGGVGSVLASEIEARTGFETRVTILGHVQRGGTPTAFDRVLATRFGVAAIEAVHDGAFGQMVALQAGEIVRVPLSDAVGELKLGRPDALPRRGRGLLPLSGPRYGRGLQFLVVAAGDDGAVTGVEGRHVVGLAVDEEADLQRHLGVLGGRVDELRRRPGTALGPAMSAISAVRSSGDHAVVDGRGLRDGARCRSGCG